MKHAGPALLALALAAALAAAGCGRTGDLTLPEDEEPQAAWPQANDAS